MCSVLSSHLCIFFEKMSIKVLFPLFHWIGCLLLLSCKYSLNILNTISTSDVWFANIFSHSIGFLFTLLIVDLWCTKYFKFDAVQFTYFCCYSSCFGVRSKNLLQIQDHKNLLPWYFLRVLYVYHLHLSLWSILISFIYGVNHHPDPLYF